MISSRWALTERFTITDQMGAPVFDVHGHFGLHKEVSFRDQSGQVLAVLKKHLMNNRYEVLVGGKHAAEVHHRGFIGQHYQVDSYEGVIDAQGDFAGWDYNLARAGALIATVSRQMAFRETFYVEVAPGENDVFILATVLAIDNIHDERRAQDHGIGLGGLPGMGGGLGGIAGREFGL